MSSNPLRAVTALALVGASLAAAPAHSISITPTDDRKYIDATACQPYGPGTIAAELTYNQLGISNPGTTNESVLCPMPTDSESSWGSTVGAVGSVRVFFRAGSIPGRVACTVFISKASMSSGAVYTVTSNPPNSAANALTTLAINLADISGSWNVGPPAVLLCTLTPKVTLGGMYLDEQASTNTP